MPFSTLQRVEKNVIEKHRKLTDGKFSVYWAVANRKKGYSTISNKLKWLLIVAFNDHPHVVVSPNLKDTLLLKNAEGEKVAICKILTMVGLGMIFSDIIKENPTIKNRVGEWAFCYLVSGLGCVRCFTDSHKTMCSCTECVGLQTMHHYLQAKRGVMHCQIAINLGHCTRKAKAEEMARGWGDVGLHPTTFDAIAAGTCARWREHAVPHWECQTMQCGNCWAYPVPAEEAREDAGAEDICFHVYEYKVSIQQGGKEWQ
jgi:hypothetical protein